MAPARWKISSTATGLSSIICQNNTGGNTGLHLAGDNKRLVPWTNNAEASLWYIEPVDEFALEINEYVAVCMPFAMTIPEGVTAYTVGDAQDIEGVTVAPLTEYGSSTVAEKTPVILAAENGTYLIGVGGNAEPCAAENKLQGVLKSASVSGSNIYSLANGKFVKRSASSGTIKANTAYYVQESDATTIELKKGDATSIEDLKAENGSIWFYDLKGNIVKKPTQGIYVTSDGKKVLVK